MKYLGLWRTRDYIENLLRLEQNYDLGIGTMLTKWDALVQEKYNFKAVDFNGRGGLKSGTFSAEQVYNEGKELSVSLLVRTKLENVEDRTVYVMSQEGMYSIRINNGDWHITLFSDDEQSVEYKVSSPASRVFDDRWHQVGFTYQASVANFVFYADGIEQPASVVSGTPFRRPLATPSQTRTVVASEIADNSQKDFSGQIDEI